jgi:linoleoyl-CoA desaturase
MNAISSATNRTRFATVLLQRLNAYFADHNKSRKADAMMVFKIVFGLSSWAVTCSVLLFSDLSNGAFFLIYVLHGCTHVFLLLNVTHDSNHQAISKRPSVNRALSYVMDLCGINSYMWRILHHHGHHSCINVYGEDEAILGRELFRFSPYAPHKRINKYQHIYVFLLYFVFSIDYALIKDIQYFFWPGYEQLKNSRHPAKEYLILFVGKLFYLGYMIVVPIVILGRSPLLVVFALVVAHAVISTTTLMVFQSTHVIESTHFPETRNEFDTYVEHIFATTALAGGLNHHVVHHLFPSVCHTHLRSTDAKRPPDFP